MGKLGLHTGNETVDQAAELMTAGNMIPGNMIPAAWFQTIHKATGKPNLTAIMILSEIVYWYQPDISYGADGEVTGVKKRFESDLLQRSYQQFAERFCISRRDATNAIVALEKLGVVKRIFRNALLGGRNVSNILYLKLDVERLKELTYPSGMQKGGKADGCDPDEVTREDGCVGADDHAGVSKSDTSRKITSISRGRSRQRTEPEPVTATDFMESIGKEGICDITRNSEMAKMRGIKGGENMAKMCDIAENGDMAKTGDVAVNGDITENGYIRCVGYPTKIGETYPRNQHQRVRYPTENGETYPKNSRQRVGYPTENGETSPRNSHKAMGYPTQNGEKYPTQKSDSNSKTFKVYRTDMERRMDKDIYIDPSYHSYQMELSRFQKQIDYDCLKFDYHNDERIDELVRIAVDALTSTAKTLRVNCEDRPASVVKAQLRKLDMFHIQYILRCLNETTGKIRNMHTYLLSTLYNAINTIDCYYKQLLAKNYRPPKKEACLC